MSPLGIAVFCALVVGVVSTADSIYYDILDAPQLFEKFKKDFKRVYRSPQDEQLHYAQFILNLREINHLNKQYYPTTTFGITQFGDYNKEEFNKMLGLGIRDMNKNLILNSGLGAGNKHNI